MKVRVTHRWGEVVEYDVESVYGEGHHVYVDSITERGSTVRWMFNLATARVEIF